jgi:hypothetical protein
MFRSIVLLSLGSVSPRRSPSRLQSLTALTILTSETRTQRDCYAFRKFAYHPGYSHMETGVSLPEEKTAESASWPFASSMCRVSERVEITPTFTKSSLCNADLTRLPCDLRLYRVWYFLTCRFMHFSNQNFVWVSCLPGLLFHHILFCTFPRRMNSCGMRIWN